VTTISGLRLVDSHCHLNFDDFDPDRDQVVSRARQNGIVAILIPGVDIETSRSAIQCAKNYPGIYAAVGVHPNSGMSWNENSLSELKQLATGGNVSAIGEIGLDYFRDFCPKEQQRKILMQQLDLAAEIGLPVIIHFRQAANDITELLVNWQSELEKAGSRLSNRPGVLHAFSGDINMATELSACHFKLGIGGPVTYPNSKDLQAVVESLPIDSFLIETDAPYLSPQLYRGKRNEPTNVRIVSEKIAEIRDIPFEQVAEITTKEASTLFGWGGMH
jgi:TatD DNase family protein